MKQMTINELPIQSAHNPEKDFHPKFDGDKWTCDCDHYKRYKTDCRHILIKKLQLKGQYHAGVRDTSIDAYVEILSDPESMTETYKKILISLEEIAKPSTDREIARHLGYTDPNKIRPRRNELADPENFFPCLIEEVGKRQCNITKKKSYVWDLTDYGRTIARSLE